MATMQLTKNSSVPKAGSRFAHLAAAKAEDDEKDSGDEAKAADDEEDKKKKDEEEAAAKKKAEDDEKKKKDDEEAKAADDEKKEKDDGEKDNTDARAADGDSDSDKSDWADTKLRAARARERGRISSIMLSDAAKLNIKAAEHFAFETSMARDEVIGILSAFGSKTPAAAAPRRELQSRMASEKQPNIGQDGPALTGAEAGAAAIIAAGKKRRGEID